jgi:hypothetical protein
MKKKVEAASELFHTDVEVSAALPMDVLRGCVPT